MWWELRASTVIDKRCGILPYSVRVLRGLGDGSGVAMIFAIIYQGRPGLGTLSSNENYECNGEKFKNPALESGS